METLAKGACVMLLCLVVIAPLAEAITCSQVQNGVAPCIGFITRGGGVPAGCCNSIRALNAAAKTTADRQTACNCLKSVAKAVPGINFSNAAALPRLCRVNVPFKISPTTDCSSVK